MKVYLDKKQIQRC